MYKTIRKKGLVILLTLAMVISLMPAMTQPAWAADIWDGTSVATSFAGGDGLSVDTAFEISTGAQLAYLASITNVAGTNNTAGKYYKLTADIDLNNQAWTPIGNATSSSTSFLGTFDGDGHVILNLKMTGATSRAGLFGQISYSPTAATVKNVGVENISISGHESTSVYAGGLVGSISYTATLQNCYTTGTITTGTSTSNRAGGLVGQTSFVSGGITNCYSTVNITSAGGWAGGLAGSHSAPISNCYAAGIISSSISNQYGACYGRYAGGTTTNCYWDSSLTATGIGTTSAGTGSPTGKTSAEMKVTGASGFAATLGTSVWKDDSESKNNGYPLIIGVGAGLDPNAAPTDIALSASSVNENVASNTTVGTLSSTDTDAGNTFTYTLVAGDGSIDNVSFNISGSTLCITNSPDYETKNSYSVRVRTTDQGGLYFEKTFTITIIDQNDVPTVTNSTKTVNEDTTLTIAATDFTDNYSDAENSPLSSVRIETLPDLGNGKLQLGGADITAAQVVNAAELGNITFVPALNFSGNTSFTWKASDGTDYSASAATMTLNITSANDTPTDIALTPSSVNENVADNTTVGTLSSTDPDAGNTFTYTLVAGMGDTDNASFSIVGSSLLITNSPDYETKNSYSVRVRTTDQDVLFYEKALTVTISNTNEPPTDIGLTANSVNENVAGNTTVGTLSSTDPDAGDTFTYTLVAGEGSTDNASFNIDGSSLRITNSPDYETKNSYSVRVRSTDQSGSGYEEAFTITVNNVNEAPTDISLTANAVNENVPGNTTVGTLSSTDPDAGNTFTYSLVTGDGSTDNGSFEIVGDTLRITLSPDRETKSSYTVRVRSTDQGSQSFDKAFTITINNVNEAPTDIALSSASVSESAGIGTTVGNLLTTDPDAADTFTYELVVGDGSGDNASFTIDGNALKTNETFVYATKNSYTIRVRTTDAGGLTYEKATLISITETNQEPTDIALTSTSIDENLAADSTVGTLSATDANTWDTFTYTLVSGDGSTDNGNFNILGDSLRLIGSGNYETKSSYSVRIRATDIGGLWYEEAYTITINNVNEDPTDITLSASSVNENVAGNTVVGTFSSTDSDAGNTFTYTLVEGDGSTDNTSFNIDGNSLRITNSPDYETKNSYSVRVRTTDQGGLWYEETFTITINNLNEAPTNITLSESSVNENVAVNTTVGTFLTTDVDAGNTFTYTLVTGDGSTDNASFNISGNSLRVSSSPNYEVKSSYSVRIRTTDQGSLWFEKAFTITISDVNEAPTDIALTASSVDENVSGNTVVSAISSTDPDALNTFTYTVVSVDGDSASTAFNIDGNSLRITNSPDYETKNSYAVRIRTTDQGAQTFEKVFTITINDLNDAPVITSAVGASFAENGTGVAYTATGTDIESDTITWSISGTDAALFTINSTTGVIEFIAVPNFEVPTDNGHDNVYDLTLTATDDGAGVLTATKDIAITVTNVNESPVISIGDSVSVVEGTAAAFTAAGSDPEGSAITWSITGGVDAAKFSIVAGTGAVTFVTVPSYNAPADADINNSYILEITASDGTLSSAKPITVTVTQTSTGGSSSSSGTTPNTGSTVVQVNGVSQSAGTTANTTNSSGQTVTTVTVDTAKLDKVIETAGDKPTVTIPVTANSDVAVAALTGQMVKSMETKAATLEVKTGSATYTLPATEINIDSVSKQLGQDVKLSDIKVQIQIAEPPAESVKIVENAAKAGEFTVMVPAVNFEISCTYNGKSVDVSKFNSYVERTVAIPEGVDPAKITTGVVVEPDGTVRHVPTQVIKVDGKYYAKINSLTNSTYTVVWNPVTFADVETHWAKDSINNMGSRMVVSGTGNGNYNPNSAITRAEFAAIVVRALGLKTGTGENQFRDVKATDWFCDYVETASEYGIINGKSAAEFAPSDKITREQAMAMIARAMKITGLEPTLTESEISKLLANYNDASSSSSYAKSSIASCLKTGVISGTSSNALAPKNNITRAEVAVIIERLLKKSELI